MVSVNELEQAKIDYQHAWQLFNNAADDYVDVAIAYLNYAITRYNKLLKEARNYGIILDRGCENDPCS